MKTQTPKVIVTENPPLVCAQGTFGGGYRKPSSTDGLVADAASALVYEGYGTRTILFIGPERVRQALIKQGFNLT